MEALTARAASTLPTCLTTVAASAFTDTSSLNVSGSAARSPPQRSPMLLPILTVSFFLNSNRESLVADSHVKGIYVFLSIRKTHGHQCPVGGRRGRRAHWADRKLTGLSLCINAQRGDVPDS